MLNVEAFPEPGVILDADETTIGRASERDVETYRCFQRWVLAAFEAVESAPDGLRGVLKGEVEVIEVSQRKAAIMEEWARGIDGWHEAPDDKKPLRFLTTAEYSEEFYPEQDPDACSPTRRGCDAESGRTVF